MPYIGRELDRGNYLKLDDISSSFDGSTTTFNLTNGGNAFYPGSAFSILVVLAGVVQEPEAAYQINQTQITFASAPLAGDQFFCIVLGQALGVNTPANGSVNGTQLAKPFNYDNYFYLDDANNRVGVGTATPMTPLHVEGTGRFTNVTVTGDLTVEGTTSTLDTVVTEVDKLEVGANNNTVGVAITQSGSGHAAIFMGGNVGINKANPGQLLTVGAITGGADGTLSVKTNSNKHAIAIEENSGNENYQLGVNSDGNLGFYNSGSTTPTVTFSDNDKVGIGIDAPLSPLDILLDDGAGDPRIRFDETQDNPFIEFNRWTGTGTGYYGIRAKSVLGDLALEFANATTIGNHSYTERFRIKSGGRVGVGTDNPQSQFEVYGSSPIVRVKHSTSQKYTQIHHDGTDGYLDWSSGGLIFRGASSAERLRITADGDFYLNRTSQLIDAKVSINADVGEALIAGQMRTNAGISTVLQTYSSSGNITSNISVDNANRSLILKGSNTEGIRITSAGDVGIGVADPDVYSLGGNNRYAAIKASAGYTVLNLVDSNNSGSYLQFGNSTVRRGSLHFDSASNFLVTINESGSGTNLTEKLRLDLNGRLTISGQGLKLNPNNSSLYTLDGSLSYYATNNAVYLNGAGANGWLRLNAAGAENNQNAINIFASNAGAYISMRTSNVERLRITSGGQINIDAPSESLGGKVLIKHNVDYTTTDFDDSPTLYLLNDDRTTGVSEAAVVFAGRNSAGSTFRAAISGNGSTGLKFYTTSNAELDDTPAMMINGSGKVGIGTDNPQYSLDLGESSSTIRLVSEHNGTAIRVGAGGGGNDVSLIRVDGTTNNHDGESDSGHFGFSIKYMGSRNSNNNSLSVFSDNQAGTQVEAVTVLQDGKVGIGTATPDKKLRVEGDARVTGTLTIGEASTVIDGSVEYPSFRPTLDLNFAATKVLDDRIAFTRDSIGTYTDENGLVKYASNNVPRFDHDPATGDSLGLLIEESRTNIINYSEDISNNTTWIKQNGFHYVVNSVSSPDGNQTADTIYKSSSTQYLYTNTTVTGTYTLSAWIKSQNSNQNFSMQHYNGVDGSLGNTTFTATTEWQRFSITASPTTSGGWYPCTPSNTNENFYIWGAQLELGAFPTSYIPTSGSSVTRAVDIAKITGTNFTDFYNQTEGTFFVEADTINPIYNNAITGFDGSNNNYTIIGTGASPNRFQIRFDDQEPFQVLGFGPNSTTAITSSSTLTPTLRGKIAGAFKQDDVRGAAQGEIILTDTSFDMISPTSLFIGSLNGSSEILPGHVRKVSYYRQALSNAQLRGLTQQ